MRYSTKDIISFIYKDLKAYKKSNSKVYLHQIIATFFLYSSFRAVVLYRIAFILDKKKLSSLAFLCEKTMHFTCNVYIGRRAIIGPYFVIRHVGAIIIGNKTVIGENCEVRQCVTFGGNMGKIADNRSQPCLGNNILVGAGAKILGPVKIGDNCIIGANAVLISDVDCNKVVAGVPAKVIRPVKDGENPLVNLQVSK